MNNKLRDKIAGSLCASRGLELMTAFNLSEPPEKDSRIGLRDALLGWHSQSEMIKTYLKAKKRITSKEWADTVREGKLESGSFDLRTVIELLREGMHHRMTGMLNSITGSSLICSSIMGLYNACDADQAFLDSYDISSVIQRDRGVESAAVFASAVASAMRPDADAEKVMDVFIKNLAQCDQDLRRSCLVAYRNGKLLSDKFPSQPESIKDALEFFSPERDWKRTEMQKNCLETAIIIFVASNGDVNSAIKAFPYIKTEAGIVGSLVGSLCGALCGYEKLPDFLKDEKKEPACHTEKFCKMIEDKTKKDEDTIDVLKKLAKPETKGETLLFSKIFGSTLAGAIGNAMGSPVEGWRWKDIEKKYGKIDAIMDARRLETEDDLQMALHIAQAFIDKGGVATSKDLARVWMRDMFPERFFLCMRNSYDLILKGFNPRYTGHGNYVTGSTLMCMQPVGFYNAGDPHKAFVDATDISYMYQRGLDVDAACIFAAMVAEAIRPGATVDSVCKTAVEYSPTNKMITFDKKPRKPDTFRKWVELSLEVASGAKDVFSVREKAYERLLQYSAIDPLEFFCLVLVIFKSSRGNIEQAVIGGTNIGRDSDSISSLSGVLTGALHGWREIPKRWINSVGERALSVFRKTSRELSELILRKKLPLMNESTHFR